MKIWKKLHKTNQVGMLSLHAIVPIVLAVAAIGGVGAYVLSKSGASNTTQGQLTAQTGAYTLVPGWSSVLKANVDPADAADELVFYNATTGQVSGYQNSTATGLTGKIYDVKANAGWAVVLAANIDGDNNDELVYYNKTTGALAFYGATATTTGAKLATNTTTVPGYDLVVAMDVDGNNANDELMFYNKTTGATKLYKVTAAGVSATPYASFTLSAGWDAIAGADFNGNGDDEATFYRRSDGLLKVYDNVAAAGVSGEMANFVIDKTWTAVVGANLKNTTKDNLYFYNSATGAVKTVDGINFAYVPAPTPPAPGTPPPSPTVYNGTFECKVGASVTEAGVAWYPVTVTNKTDKATSTLSEISMRGVRADNSWTSFNGSTNKSEFSWKSGFSGEKMLVNRPVKYNIKTNNMLQDRWILSISGKQYDCVKDATGTSGGTTVDTRPYTTLPGVPAVNSSTYKAWKAWSDGVAANRALTGQTLINKLKPLKDAYDAEVKFVSSISCKPTFPATITLGQQVKTSLTVTSKLATSIPANTLITDLTEKYSDADGPTLISGVNIPILAANGTAKADATTRAYQRSTSPRTVTLSYKLKRNVPYSPVVSNCTDSYKSYDLTTGKVTDTPNADKPAAVVLVGKPPVIAPPADPGTPAAKKVSDLGYSPELMCVVQAANGKLLADKTCAKATALLLVVNVDKTKGEGKPARKELTYDIDIIKTKDKSNKAQKCDKRVVVVGNTNRTYACTVLFTNKNVFTVAKDTVKNRFIAIFNRAKRDSNLTASEARLRISELRNQDTLATGVNIAMTYKKYQPQLVKNYKITFDYDENSYVRKINGLIQQESTTPANNDPSATSQNVLHGYNVWSTDEYPKKVSNVRVWDSHNQKATWAEINPQQGVWNWTGLDAITATAKQRNVKDVTYVLGMTPEWAASNPVSAKNQYTGPGSNTVPKNLSDWDAYVTAVATRYKGKIAYYQVWNEPQVPRYLYGSDSKDIDKFKTLAVMTKRAKGIINRIDPEAKIVSAPVISRSRDYRNSASVYYKELATQGWPVDIFATHIYAKDAKDWESQLKSNKAQLVAAKAPIKPYWVTETNFTPKNKKFIDTTTALKNIAAVAKLAPEQGVDRVYWYAYGNLEWTQTFLGVPFYENSSAAQAVEQLQ